jgi:hypothetical protein
VSCFSSADESAHYGFSVCMLLEQYRQQLGWEDGGVVELGTGDASAIADVVAALPGLRVRSYDISATSVDKAPPYIPAPDRDILMPELWGGVHGNDLVLQLLKAGYPNVICAVASYSDPVTTVTTAGDLGYRVANFLAMGLDYGPYSSEPKVRDHIRRLCAEGRGWTGEDDYMVAVALFTQDPDIPGDRGTQLLKALQV